jgi:CRISPR-associated protein (TIGR03986 family)
METLSVELEFVQPVRIIPWQKKESRKTDKEYKRGTTFARWHMDDTTKKAGFPYITGTLLRSALIREIEDILVSHNSYQCCRRPDKTEKDKPDFLRKKPASDFQKKSADPDDPEKFCTQNTPCPLCLLKGYFDTFRKKSKKKCLKRFTVHLTNLKSENENLIWDRDVWPRKLNRVDPVTGKAKDYYTVNEISPASTGRFKGEITINYPADGEKKKQIKTLIALGLAQVKVLGGSICRADITNLDHNALIDDYFSLTNDQNDDAADRFPPKKPLKKSSLPNDFSENLKETMEVVEGLYKGSDRSTKLRTLANVLFSLRSYPKKIVEALPSGAQDKKHFLWDNPGFAANGLTLRQVLKKTAKSKEMNSEISWVSFCEQLGKKVHALSKKAGGNLVSRPRLLGETEYFGTPRILPENNLPSVHSSHQLFWVLAGELTAETPFFFGNQKEEGVSDHPILLDQAGYFRLPASVLRGVIRRDLRAVIGDGCNMPLGHRPCSCPVCRIMNNLIVEDGVSDCRLPPEIRTRIRLNPHTGVVENGALFDQEVGFEGMTFPFRLYLRTPGFNFENNLKAVFHLWQKDPGQAFIGGNIGSGYGRFSLKELRYKDWNITTNEVADLLKCRSFTTLTFPDAPDESEQLDISTFSEKPDLALWEPITLLIQIDSPLLTKDTIRAMMDPRNPDVVMFKKAVFTPSGNGTPEPPCYKYVIKGESVRGIFRSAMGRTDIGQKEQVYDIDHESCECIQCRLFGNVHQQGGLRFEDLEITNFSADHDHDIKMDHVVIDRFTGGGIDHLKYNDYPLPGSPEKQLTLKGIIWVKTGLDTDDKNVIGMILADLRDGFLTMGGLGAIGYGQVSGLTIENPPAWLELPESRVQTIDLTESEKLSNTKWQAPALNRSAIYYPHAFLPPLETDVIRETKVVSHVKGQAHDGESLFSGKIHCLLTTCGPVFVPDTGNSDYFSMQKDHAGHINYGFFRINEQVAIPGSSIRGMISSVYEALTHSCFRMLEQDRYISRSIKPDPDKRYPGRIEQKPDGSLEVEKLKNIYRLPIYDLDKLWNQNAEQRYSHIDSSVMDCNKNIATAAKQNQEFLEHHFSDEQRERVLQGIEPIFFKKISSHGENGYAEDIIACLISEEEAAEAPNTGNGFIKFTGPNMVNLMKPRKKSHDDHSKLSRLDQPPESLWQRIQHGQHNEIKLRPSQNKKYPRPVMSTSDKTHAFSMLKRCEHIFEDTAERETFSVPPRIRKQYESLRKDNKNNTDTLPELFRTWTPDSKLSDGDLVYFSIDGKKNILKIEPVRIARTVDPEPLGKRFPENNHSLQPCHHQCLENCPDCPETCPISVSGGYFPPHPRGLCPACHLFGTPHYKGRVKFQTAWHQNEIKWFKPTGNPDKGRGLTLPRLERPRPTWSMPNQKGEDRLPGRKFFLHHPWSVPGINESVQDMKNRTTIEPLAKNNEFKFTVAFHHLRRWELGILLYALELESGMAHKMGMGKALGMGSVAITAESIDIRKDDRLELTHLKKTALMNDGLEYVKNKFVKHSTKYEQYLTKLHDLLWLPETDPESDDQIQVRYPKLRQKEDIEKKPGYVELKSKKEKTRDEILKSAWRKPWFDIQTGIVKSFEKGYGFIEQENGPDIFVHHLDIEMQGFRTLNQGDWVEFSIGKSPKGAPAAKKVKKIAYRP